MKIVQFSWNWSSWFLDRPDNERTQVVHGVWDAAEAELRTDAGHPPETFPVWGRSQEATLCRETFKKEIQFDEKTRKGWRKGKIKQLKKFKKSNDSFFEVTNWLESLYVIHSCSTFVGNFLILYKYLHERYLNARQDVGGLASIHLQKNI